MVVLLCCGKRTLAARKAMRRRVNEDPEMSGQNYFREQAAKERVVRNVDQSKVPRYAEFEVDESISPDRLPLNPSSQTLLASNRADRLDSDRSGETVSTNGTGQSGFRVNLPPGPSSYVGVGYPPTVRLPPNPYPNPYASPQPMGTAATDRQFASSPGPRRKPPSTPSNTSLNSMNRPPPRSNYEMPIPPSPVQQLEKRASSVYSDYVPPQRPWVTVEARESRSLNDEYGVSDRYPPQRPTIDTRNLNSNDRAVDRSPVAARRTPDIDPAADRLPSRTRGVSDLGTAAATYYEDIDPRFDDTPDDEVEVGQIYRAPLSNPQSPHRPSHRLDEGDQSVPITPLRRNYSYNSLDGRNSRGNNVDDEYRSGGPRSPAASTSSHFTSISQRGVNPRWQPQPPQYIGGGNSNDGYSRRQHRPRNDQMNFLAGNPDFELPVSRSGRRQGGGPASLINSIDTGGRYPLPR